MPLHILMTKKQKEKSFQPAVVIYELSQYDELARCPLPWQNMIASLQFFAPKIGLRSPTIPLIQRELNKWDATYDGSPYVFFRSKRKFILWELKYSTVDTALDIPS